MFYRLQQNNGKMALSFPNRSRSYDATRRAVRFWGHDGPMEAALFVDESALRRIEPGVGSDGAELLRAFNSNRNLIYAAAARIYARARKGSYQLVSTDF